MLWSNSRFAYLLFTFFLHFTVIYASGPVFGFYSILPFPVFVLGVAGLRQVTFVFVVHTNIVEWKQWTRGVFIGFVATSDHLIKMRKNILVYGHHCLICGALQSRVHIDWSTYLWDDFQPFCFPSDKTSSPGQHFKNKLPNDVQFWTYAEREYYKGKHLRSITIWMKSFKHYFWSRVAKVLPHLFWKSPVAFIHDRCRVYGIRLNSDLNGIIFKHAATAARKVKQFRKSQNSIPLEFAFIWLLLLYGPVDDRHYSTGAFRKSSGLPFIQINSESRSPKAIVM